MKKILIPIDFSETSENAFRYALAFTQNIKAKLICLYAYQKEETEENILAKIELLKKNNLTSSFFAAIEFIYLPETLENAVDKCTKKHKINLILMGTKGTQGFNKLMSVSHTTDLLSQFEIPFLIIPESFTFNPYKYIMWASDFKFLNNDNAIDLLVEIAKKFDAEVRIAHVKTSKQYGSQAEHLERSREKYLFDAENVKFSFKRIYSSNISEGVQYYLKLKKDNDLLVLVRRKHGFMIKLFRTDHAMEFASVPSMPLLILHE